METSTEHPRTEAPRCTRVNGWALWGIAAGVLGIVATMVTEERTPAAPDELVLASIGLALRRAPPASGVTPAYGTPRPLSLARATASARVAAGSLASITDTWLRTVFSLTPRWWASTTSGWCSAVCGRKLAKRLREPKLIDRAATKALDDTAHLGDSVAHPVPQPESTLGEVSVSPQAGCQAV